MTAIHTVEKKVLNSFDQLDYDMSPTPEQLTEIYNNGFMGVIPDKSAYYSMRILVERFSDAFPEATGLGKGKVNLPFKAALTLEPEFGRYESQTTGDCREGSSLVKMADLSNKKLMDVKIGDYVISGLGIKRKVIDFIKKPYNGKLVKVYVDGYPDPITTTPDHKILSFPNINKKIHDDIDREHIDRKPIINLEIGDYILMGKPIDESITIDPILDLTKYCPCEYIDEFTDTKSLRLEPVLPGKIRIKNGRSSSNREVKINDKFGWLIGIYLAEGGIDGKDEKRNIKNCRITFNLGSHEAVIAKQIQQYFKELFDVDARIYQVPSKPSVIYVRVYNLIIANLFKQLCPGIVYTKSISTLLKKTTISTRLSILKGWLDGDGHLNKKDRYTGATVSKELAKDLFDLANSCGLSATIGIVPAKIGHQEAYILGFSKNDTNTITKTKRVLKIGLSKHVTKYGLAKKIRKIEIIDCPDDYVYCIGVENDHCFISDGFSINNCVSHGTRNAGMIDYCIDALFGETEYQGRFCTENIYGARGHRGQGANCATLARYVSQEGVGGFLVRKKHISKDGRNSIDLSIYNSRIGAGWGPITPSWVNELASENKALRVFSIKTVEEYVDALAAGFGINVCSGYGFSSSRNEDGVCEQRGRWAHAMAHVGCDDSDWAHQKYGGTMGLIQNSWGVWNKGPKRHDQAEGSFWIRPSVLSKMISGGGAWCIASVRGYNRELVYDTMSRVAELSKD